MTLTVVHVNVAKAFRGGERQTELLLRGLAARGVTQRLVARRGAPLVARTRDLDLDVREVGGDVLGVFAATRGADIVHVHEGRSVYAAHFRKLVSGTPYILTRRVDNPIRDHYFAHCAYRAADRVAAVAPQVAEIVQKFDPDIDVCTIHDCSSGLTHNPAVTAAIRSSLPGRFVVGHVGALDNDQKGQEFIIEVAREFARRHAEVCFVLVGGGEDEAILKALARGLDNVVFTGFVDNVGDYLAAFDVFMMPSRREGMGSILLDAMDFSLPIVATSVGGIPAIVENDENGILVESGDVVGLAAGVERLLANPEERVRMGRYGREVSRAFTADVMVARYLDLYRAATDSPSLGNE